MTNEQLVRRLVGAAYDSGYYSGKGEDGSRLHVAAMKSRAELRRQVLARLALVPDAGLVKKLAQGVEEIHDEATGDLNRDIIITACEDILPCIREAQSNRRGKHA